ncbi:MAG TPA: hypothetical protein VG204_14825 [Terriglobia bacterium]|nr:hypothetical protein [Terriglobia bacterium]
MIQPLRIPFVVFLAAISASVAAAQANVRYYRYALSLRSQETTYSVEVPEGAHGHHFEVETDAQGRIVRAASIRYGQKEGEILYHFAGDSKLADGYETYRAGEKTGRTEIQRNAHGDWVRADSFTVAGTRTGYTVYSYGPDSVEVTSYMADGKPTQVWINSYSAKGTLTGGIEYPNPVDGGFHVDVNYDESTGLKKTRRQIRDGNVENSGTFTYDADGEEIRQDAFNASGQWFAAGEYRDGLVTRRLYHFGKELHYAYDDQRRLKETKLLLNDALVCRFVYERLADGTVKRTLALGPDGTLWAEYPDQEIWEVDNFGQPISGKSVVMHKAGRWY